MSGADKLNKKQKEAPKETTEDNDNDSQVTGKGKGTGKGRKKGGLSDALQIPAGFRSFLRIPVPFQWNLPAKFSLQPRNFVIPVFRPERNGTGIQ
jgi:hypothetical protein